MMCNHKRTIPKTYELTLQNKLKANKIVVIKQNLEELFFIVGEYLFNKKVEIRIKKNEKRKYINLSLIQSPPYFHFPISNCCLIANK